MLKYEIFVSKKPVDGREIEELKGLPVIKPFQVHGSRVAFVGRKLSLPPKADALVTDSKKVWIGVLSADCLPVFLVGEGTVGVVHAGWRGTLKGVTYNTVKYISKFSPVKEAILGAKELLNVLPHLIAVLAYANPEYSLLNWRKLTYVLNRAVSNSF